MSNLQPIGVLVMSYGTPESLDQVEAYYTHIRRGRPPTAEQLHNLTDRYEQIVGGFFPLRRNTDRQIEALQQMLDDLYGPGRFVCYQGLKHAQPYIEDGVKAMFRDGIKQAVGIVLAPHYSEMSVGSYIKRAADTAGAVDMEMSFVKSYHLHPALLDALTERVKLKSEQAFTSSEQSSLHVIFSAHSLPASILEMNDPYPEQLRETAAAIAERLGIPEERWVFSWQSAGQTAVPWLGPDILTTIRNLGQEQHVKSLLVCPVGFVSDHLEVLYDIDIEAQQTARELHLHLERTESLNTDPRYMTALAESIIHKVKEGIGYVGN